MDIPLPYGWETVAEGFHRCVIVEGEKLMLVQVHLAAGVTIAPHSHPHEQATYVLAGEVQFTLDQETIMLKSGQCAPIPGGVSHSVLAVKDSLLLDVFSPPRDDLRRTT